MKMYCYTLYVMLLSMGMVSSRPASNCGKKPADVVFLVDTSSSIWQPAFTMHVLPFVRDVVDMFDIGPSATQTRIGMVTFGDDFYHQFHLNEFQTKEELAVAINKTPFNGGNTFTHRALQYVSKEMFTKENGARDDVVHIAVVLTDGASDVPEKTKEAVAIIKGQGVKIFAVGVGHRVDYRELRAMASEPKDDFMFHVRKFQALNSIKEKLALKTCEVTVKTVTATTTESSTTSTTEATTTTTTTTTTTAEATTSTEPTTTSTTQSTTEPTTVALPTASGIVKSTEDPLELPQGDQPKSNPEPEKCENIPADVYFILDVSSSLWVYHFNNKVLPFVQDLASTFDIGPKKTRLGVVTFADNITPVFGLNEYTSSEELLKAINPDIIKYTGERKTNTASALSYVRKKGFAAHVARKDVAQIIIVITDGLSYEPAMTAMEAKAAKDAGMYMFAIGVGPSVDPAEMKAIGSEPYDRFVFHVNTYDALSGVKDMLAAETCNIKGVSSEKICNVDSTDLIFVFESASKLPSSRLILRSVITDFAEKLKLMASRVRVGSLTDPCPAEEELSFLSLDSFKQKVETIVEHKESKMHRLMRKLRLDKFNPKMSDKNENADNRKIGVIFLDEKTVAPSRVVGEAEKLKKKGVELYAVTVGDVSEYMTAGVASDATHVIRLNDYSHLKSVKLDRLWNICAQ